MSEVRPHNTSTITEVIKCQASESNNNCHLDSCLMFAFAHRRAWTTWFSLQTEHRLHQRPDKPVIRSLFQPPSTLCLILHVTQTGRRLIWRNICSFQMKSRLHGATVTVSSTNPIILWPSPNESQMSGNYCGWPAEWNVHNSIFLLVAPATHFPYSTIHHAKMIWHVFVTWRQLVTFQES